MTQHAALTCLFLATLAFFSCKKEQQPDTPVGKIEFKGITMVDENGQALSSPDPDDWAWDATWRKEEKELFPGLENVPSCYPDEEIKVFPAYANPCNSSFTLTLNHEAETYWLFRLVDKDFNVLRLVDSVPFELGYNSIAFQLGEIPNDTLRLYYMAARQGCVFRGHGDILKKE